ncbi:glutamate receptor ionotropic, delta-2-like [Cylas formicarius]|uniref:glutamate receptor ionotropic, delta-2-like n=1 Tax=Cylas formicarius TaxID=197179 RepID=UPI002958CEEB|nr:glutamate receptor ionotropic, delta-2-like [Cylas formicarius]
MKVFKMLNGSTGKMIAVSNLNYINIFDALYTKHRRTGIVADADCTNIDNLLVKCGRYKLFDPKYRWLILASSKNYRDIFEGVDINVDVDITVVYPARNSNSTTKYIFMDIYNPASEGGGSLKTTHLGFDNDSLDRRLLELETNKNWIRRDLTGVTFNAMVVLHDPFVGNYEDYIISDDHREINTYDRFHYRLMYQCKDHHNFSFNTSWGKLYGYKTSNGTMDGLVGEMEQRRVDMGLSPLFIQEDRAKVISYGRRTWFLRSAFVFRNPKSLNSLEIFVRPFSAALWFAVFLLAIVSAFVLRFSLRCETNHRVDTPLESTWSYVILSVIGSFCQQGVNAVPAFFCGKIGIISLLLVTTMVYQFYSASLVSSLINVPLVLINSLDNLLRSNLKIGIENIAFNIQYFKRTTDPSALRLYNKWVLDKEDEAYLNASDGLQLMKKGQYAFHVELVKAYAYMKANLRDDEICEVTQLPMFSAISTYANFVKHSPFQNLINVCLQRIAESGVMRKELEFWHDKKPECVYASNINTGIEEFYPAISVVGVGLVFGLNLLMLEILYNLWTQNRLLQFIN